MSSDTSPLASPGRWCEGRNESEDDSDEDIADNSSVLSIPDARSPSLNTTTETAAPVIAVYSAAQEAQLMETVSHAPLRDTHWLAAHIPSSWPAEWPPGWPLSAISRVTFRDWFDRRVWGRTGFEVRCPGCVSAFGVKPSNQSAEDRIDRHVRNFYGHLQGEKDVLHQLLAKHLRDEELLVAERYTAAQWGKYFRHCEQLRSRERRGQLLSSADQETLSRFEGKISCGRLSACPEFYQLWEQAAPDLQ
jgi:hypothetical protein